MNKMLSIIVPVYNEIGTVETVIKKLIDLKLYNNLDKEIIIVILANRTYPNDSFSFSENNVRTRIQEIVYESIIN